MAETSVLRTFPLKEKTRDGGAACRRHALSADRAGGETNRRFDPLPSAKKPQGLPWGFGERETGIEKDDLYEPHFKRFSEDAGICTIETVLNLISTERRTTQWIRSSFLDHRSSGHFDHLKITALQCSCSAYQEEPVEYSLPPVHYTSMTACLFK